MTLIGYVPPFVCALLATVCLLPIVIGACHERGWLDVPGGRRRHPFPVPRLGGVALFVSFNAVVVTGFLASPWFSSLALTQSLFPQLTTALSSASLVELKLIGLIVGGAVIFSVGVIDDLLGDGLPVSLKFLGQCVACAIPVACGIHVEFAGSVPVNLALSFVWILGITNAFNLLDNMDGLAASVAIGSSSIFFLNAFALGETFLCLVLATLIGTLAGFLKFNRHPARVFMGDGGALFTGFVLSSLTILEHYVSPASSSLFPVLMPILVLAVPILDTASVIAIRIREGRPIYRGDRCHLSHRLAAAGLSEPQAVKLLFALTILMGLGAIDLAHATLPDALWRAASSATLAGVMLLGLSAPRSWSPLGVPPSRQHGETVVN